MYITGKLCVEEINHCDSEPCENGATCSNHRDSFICHCAAGFAGETCQVIIAGTLKYIFLMKSHRRNIKMNDNS
jgi:hypothetical protein